MWDRAKRAYHRAIAADFQSYKDVLLRIISLAQLCLKRSSGKQQFLPA